MLTRYELTLESSRAVQPESEWAYPLYAALLEQLPETVAESQHIGDRTPISQFLRCDPDGTMRWHVSLLGTAAEDVIAPVLETNKVYHLRKLNTVLQVTDRRKVTISSVEDLLTEPHKQKRKLRFCTPTAFKSRGEYELLPTPERMLQNLVRQWNVCVPECSIEDEDNEGIFMLTRDLRYCGLELKDRTYRLKGHPIPGIMGTLTLDNRYQGFLAQLVNGLLTFATFSGVGIKTTLGMGGIIEEPLK